jgi:hypothetical protein
MEDSLNNTGGVTQEEIVSSFSEVERTVAEKLRLLESMDYVVLRDEWRRLYRSNPPKRVARELLLLGVAWKVQEKAYGGHSAIVKRRLVKLSETLGENDAVNQNRTAQLKPGAKLIREWHGRTHTVIALDDGFEWQGERWRSLSVIARRITGARWSGPRFFGLRKTTGAVPLAQTAGGGTDNA